MSDQTVPLAPQKGCRILSLDGGGAKGFYSLGVLREIEALVGSPLCEHFDLVFGTSTGAIIAALIGLGYPIDEIHALYKTHVPEIMGARSRAGKSEALGRLAESVFGERKFDQMKTGVGIVTAKWVSEKPMIFKSLPKQAHGRRQTFEPGFGCTISDAVQASCSAYPFFNRKTVRTSSGDNVELVDGGYCANNPTLYAIADAKAALGYPANEIGAVSVGVGIYPDPKPSFWMGLAKKYLVSVQLLQKTLDINTSSMDQLRIVLFPDVETIRISDTYDRPEMATDLFEKDLNKLNLIRQRGADSFASRESALSKMLLKGE